MADFRTDILAAASECAELGKLSPSELHRTILDAYEDGLTGDRLRRRFNLDPKPDAEPGYHWARVKEPQGEEDSEPVLVQVKPSWGHGTLRAFTFGGRPDGVPLDTYTDYTEVEVVKK